MANTDQPWQAADWGLTIPLCLKCHTKLHVAEKETPDKRKVWKPQVRQQVALFSISVQQFTVYHQDKHRAKLKLRACMTGYLARHLLIKAWGKRALSHLSPVCYVLWRWDDLISFKPEVGNRCKLLLQNGVQFLFQSSVFPRYSTFDLWLYCMQSGIYFHIDIAEIMSYLHLHNTGTLRGLRHF